jgi:hypothetical protein
MSVRRRNSSAAKYNASRTQQRTRTQRTVNDEGDGEDESDAVDMAPSLPGAR